MLLQALNALSGEKEHVVDALAADLPAVVIDELESARVGVVAVDHLEGAHVGVLVQSLSIAKRARDAKYRARIPQRHTIVATSKGAGNHRTHLPVAPVLRLHEAGFGDVVLL